MTALASSSLTKNVYAADKYQQVKAQGTNKLQVNSKHDIAH